MRGRIRGFGSRWMVIRRSRMREDGAGVLCEELRFHLATSFSFCSSIQLPLFLELGLVPKNCRGFFFWKLQEKVGSDKIIIIIIIININERTFGK